MDDKVKKAIEFVQNSQKRTSIFDRHEEIIFAMRENGGTLKNIIDYLCICDNSFKEKYENKKSNALPLLQRFIKRRKADTTNKAINSKHSVSKPDTSSNKENAMEFFTKNIKK